MKKIQDQRYTRQICILNKYWIWRFVDKEWQKSREKRLAPTIHESILETISEKHSTIAWGLLPSGALSAPPKILLSNYFELKYKDGAYYIWAYTRKIIFDYSLGGYFHRERWARTRWCLFMSRSKEGEERIHIWHYSHRERGFYKSWLSNPNILCVGSVKQGCDIWFSSCVIATKLECRDLSRR
jgi:hypothetical protein